MSQQIMFADLTRTFSSIISSPYQLGQMFTDTYGRLWQFGKGGGTIAQYEYVKVSTDGNYTFTSMTTTTNPSTEPAQVGCLQMSGGLTSSLYGWAFRGKGSHTGLFAASCVQDVKIYTTATNGVVDDASTTLVAGLKLLTTITSAAASAAWACETLTTANA